MNGLSDADLLAYLDGNAPPEVAAEIESSHVYQERMRQLSQFENNLTAQFYRVNCPDAQQLGEYQLRLLPSAEMLQIRAHLATCPLCKDDLVSLQEFITPQPGVVERIRLILAGLLSAAGPDLPRTAPVAGLRGSEPAPMHFAADGLEILIEIHPQESAPEYRTMVGLAMGNLHPGTAVELFASGGRISRVPVDDLGNFRLDGLLPGSYVVVIVSPEEEVYLPAIVVQ